MFMFHTQFRIKRELELMKNRKSTRKEEKKEEARTM